jgi:hypothetical protein
MAAIHHQAFAAFVKTGKSKTHGALKFRGDAVYSYAVQIGKVDRDAKRIVLCTEGYSPTTSRHQRAVALGHAIHFPDWELVKQEDSLS